MKRKLKYKKVIQFVLSAIFTIQLIIVPFTGCKRVLPYFDDFAAVWSCDYDDIELEIISTSVDLMLNGKLIYNGNKYDVIIRVYHPAGYGLYIYDASIISFSECVSIKSLGYPYTTEDPEIASLIEKRQTALLLTASCDGYKNKLTLTIKKDNLSLDQSLVGRKLVLKESEIPIPQE